MERPASIASRYRLERRLGQGGMGVVWRAVQVDLDRAVALKVMSAEAARDPDFGGRFVLEARLAARITHPGVVRVFDFGVPDTGGAYIAYELVDGEDLGALLARQLPSAARARALVAEIADALAALHSAGVLHRDLKPANAMVARDGRVRLIDLGIARDLMERAVRTAPGVVLGTPAYLSPEQVSGEPATAASDVYALGAVCFELLTGRPPFERAGVVEVLAAHVAESPLDPRAVRPGADPALSELALRCLEKDPAARPTLVEILDALKDPAGGEVQPGVSRAVRAVASRPTKASAPSRPAPGATRRSAVAPAESDARPAQAVGILAALAFVCALVAFGASRGSAPEPTSVPSAAMPSVEAIPKAGPSPTVKLEASRWGDLAELHALLDDERADLGRLAVLAERAVENAFAAARLDQEELVWAFLICSAFAQHVEARGAALPGDAVARVRAVRERARNALGWPRASATRRMADAMDAVREEFEARLVRVGVPRDTGEGDPFNRVQERLRRIGKQTIGEGRRSEDKAVPAGVPLAAVRATLERWIEDLEKAWPSDPGMLALKAHWAMVLDDYTRARDLHLRGIVQFHDAVPRADPDERRPERPRARFRVGTQHAHKAMHLLPEEWSSNQLLPGTEKSLRGLLVIYGGASDGMSPSLGRRLLQQALLARRGVGVIFRDGAWRATTGQRSCALLDAAMLLASCGLEDGARALVDRIDHRVHLKDPEARYDPNHLEAIHEHWKRLASKRGSPRR